MQVFEPDTPMIADLINQWDPILHTECIPFDFETGYTLEDGRILMGEDVFKILRDSMCAHRGIGLSACQIGLPIRVFVMGNPDDPSSVIPVFNPMIVSSSEELHEIEEGCLSFPGLFIKIKRPEMIRARFANTSGVIDSATFTGLSAHVFQHEFDHLYGMVFTRRAHWKDLDKARMQQKKLNRQKKRNAQNK